MALAAQRIAVPADRRSARTSGTAGSSTSAGVYSVEVSFSEDLVVELRDAERDRVLASQAIAVIRQALQLRHKRRPPWNIFY